MTWEKRASLKVLLSGANVIAWQSLVQIVSTVMKGGCWQNWSRSTSGDRQVTVR